MPITGKEASRASAIYPKDFCEEYAKLAVKHFQKMGKQEFLKLKMESKRTEVSDVQDRQRKKKKRKREGKEEEEEEDPPRNPVRLVEWKGGQGTHGMLKEESKKSGKPDQLDFVGGMRDPAKVVERFSHHDELGQGHERHLDRVRQRQSEGVRSCQEVWRRQMRV